MNNLPEQFAEMNQANVDNALKFAQLSLESAERMLKLQLDAAKNAIEDSARLARTVTEVKDVQQAMALRSELAESSVEKVLEYSRSIYEIASQTQVELSQLLENNLAAFNKTTISSMEKAGQMAPGADVAMQAMKSTVAATAAMVDTMTKAAKQVATMADASVKSAAEATTKAAKGKK